MTDVIREDLANVDVFQIYTENTAINGVAYVLFVLSDSFFPHSVSLQGGMHEDAMVLEYC